MILDVLLSINESKLLLEFTNPVIWIDVFIKSLSDGSSDRYTGDIVGVFNRYRY